MKFYPVQNSSGDSFVIISVTKRIFVIINKTTGISNELSNEAAHLSV